MFTNVKPVFKCHNWTSWDILLYVRRSEDHEVSGTGGLAYLVLQVRGEQKQGGLCSLHLEMKKMDSNWTLHWMSLYIKQHNSSLCFKLIFFFQKKSEKVTCGDWGLNTEDTVDSAVVTDEHKCEQTPKQADSNKE